MDVHTGKERSLDLVVGDLVPRAPSTWGCGWGCRVAAGGGGQRRELLEGTEGVAGLEAQL